MQANPWEMNWGGDPIIAPPDPYKQASEARAQEDQQIQRERLDIARQSEQRQANNDARKVAREESGFDATEGERKAGAFLIRALGANTSYEGAGVGPRSLPSQMARDTFPNVTNYMTGSDRQTAESAQDEFIAASLRD